MARNVRLANEYLSGVGTSASHWLNEKYWEIRSFQDAPKSLGELHDGVFQADKRGYDVYHIVERASARNDGYPDRIIDRADNLVLIPRYKHWEINSWFETPNKDYDELTPRQYLQGKSWDEKRYIGLKALSAQAVKRVNVSKMTTDQLVQLFADLAVQQDAALLYREQREVNKIFWKLEEIESELKSRPGDQRAFLLPLYDHKNMQVRVKAAKATLAIAPEAARAQLEAIRASGWQPQALEAGMSIGSLDEGIYKPA